MSENNLENKNSLLVTGLLKVWDAERQNEKNKETKSDGCHPHCFAYDLWCPMGSSAFPSLYNQRILPESVDKRNGIFQKLTILEFSLQRAVQ